MWKQRKDKIKRRKTAYLERKEREGETKVPEEILDLIKKDKDWLRAFYSTESVYDALEFIQAFIFLILYFFFFGYFTNILLFCYQESDQPVYMARLHGFLGMIRLRTIPLEFNFCGMEMTFKPKYRIDKIVVFN